MLKTDAPATRLGEEAVGRWLLAWAELEPRPRMVLDRGRTVLWTNPPARRMLEAGTDLHLREGLLQPIETRHQARFAAFVAEAGLELSAWCLPRWDGDGELLFRARLIAPEVVGLTFNATGSEYEPRWADLRTLFGLTAAEAGTVALLLDGLTAERIALRMGVSLETVRSHIRRAYAKTGVSSREQLFRRMAPYRLA